MSDSCSFFTQKQVSENGLNWDHVFEEEKAYIQCKLCYQNTGPLLLLDRVQSGWLRIHAFVDHKSNANLFASIGTQELLVAGDLPPALHSLWETTLNSEAGPVIHCSNSPDSEVRILLPCSADELMQIAMLSDTSASRADDMQGRSQLYLHET